LLITPIYFASSAGRVLEGESGSGAAARLSAWIGFHLQREYLWRGNRGTKFLARVARVAALAQQTPPEVDAFICGEWLGMWDGQSEFDRYVGNGKPVFFFFFFFILFCN
jgi:hypothetical protein